jgi:lipopolysaccharide transport system ATP-binding protein
MKPVIKVENVSKRYMIGAHQPAGKTLREVIVDTARAPLARWRDRSSRRREEAIWALDGVSFQADAGEAVAVIGRNGAGKSTLLKVLSRITEPTGGRVEIYGRVGSLLEVGTGFHQELTGRENILLNGAILGMPRQEIIRKFDEIVSFAEVDRFIDTPVKKYSSGMYMRLAFAVAAHLEPEILLVDEVLAVGDANFQKKCLGKMNEVAHHGRTVLFVSHNMTAVNQLCPRTIMLADGRVLRDGPTAEVVPEYLKTGSGGGEIVFEDEQRAPGNDRVRLAAVRTVSKGAPTSEVYIDREVAVEVDFWSYERGARNLCVNIYLLDAFGNTVLSTANTPNANAVRDDWFGQPHEPGLYRAVCTFPANFLNDGLYYITVYIVALGPLEIILEAPQILMLNVFDTGVMREPGGGPGRWAGVVRPRLPWQTQMLRSRDSEAAYASQTGSE